MTDSLVKVFLQQKTATQCVVVRCCIMLNVVLVCWIQLQELRFREVDRVAVEAAGEAAENVERVGRTLLGVVGRDGNIHFRQAYNTTRIPVLSACTTRPRRDRYLLCI